MAIRKKPSVQSEHIFLFHGEDDYQTQAKVSAWTEAFRRKHGQNGIVTLDLRDSSDDPIRAFEAALSSGGLFATTRLVIVRSLFQQKADLQEQFLGVSESVGSDVFVIFWESDPVRKNLKSYKKLVGWQKSGRARIEEFTLPQGTALTGFITKEAGKRSLKLIVEALHALVERVGGGPDQLRSWSEAPSYNSWQIISEIEKLAAYSSGKPIGEAEVAALVGRTVDENIFSLTEAIGVKDLPRSLHKLDELLEASAGSLQEEKSQALAIVGALASQFSSLLILRSSVDSGESQAKIASQMNWSPWRLRSLSRLMRYYSEAVLQESLKGLLAIDKKLKSTALPPSSLLADFLLNTINRAAQQ